MGRALDHKSRSHFNLTIEQVDPTKPKGECKHCHQKISQAGGNLKQHLSACGPFLHWKSNQEVTEPRGRIETYTTSLSTAQIRLFQRQAAKALFCAGQPLNTYSNKEQVEHFRMVNPAYQLLSRERISTVLLDEVYQEYLMKVNKIFQSAPLINIIFDGSENRNSDRVFNVSAQPLNQAAFYWTTIDTGSLEMTAANHLPILKPILNEITTGPPVPQAGGHPSLPGQPNLKRINSFSSDTCNTNVALHSMISSDSQLSHCFTILCDSHGLQLLIKDIPEKSVYTSTHKKAVKLIGDFASSKLQMARLRDEQREAHGKPMAFLSSVITRCGSQVAAITSILRTERALLRFADRADIRKPGRDQPTSILNTVNDRSFWQELRILEEILTPIHEAQKMSESDQSSLGKVSSRWQSIQDQWDVMALRIPEVPWDLLRELRAARLKTQSNRETLVAWALDPATRTTPLSWQQSKDVIEFLCSKFGKQLTAEQRLQIDREFFDFRGQQGIWDHTFYHPY